MDRMTETEARELLEYIYNKPSYLFLGQAYQRESLNKNSYLDKLYAEAGCSDSIHSWRNLLEDHSDGSRRFFPRRLPLLAVYCGVAKSKAHAGAGASGSTGCWAAGLGTQLYGTGRLWL